MNRKSASKVEIKAFDDLFGNNENMKDAVEVPISELHSFKKHPFIVRYDDKFDEMVESIKKVGILNPAIVRKNPAGGYEIISGHTRKEAAVKAGLTTIPAIIRDYDDDLAVIAMVDSNLQREEISISEKAKAYAMKYEAMKHQGINGGGLSLKTMSEETGEGIKTIQRLVKLSKLSDDLLKMMDDKRLGLSQGLNLTELSKKEQKDLYSILTEEHIKLSMQQSSDIKEASKDRKLDKDEIKEILGLEEGNEDKVSKSKQRSSFEMKIYKCFAGTGILSWNKKHNAYGIKKDGKWIVEECEDGDIIKAFLGGKWIETSIKRDPIGEWYLEGTDRIRNLENIIVKE